MNMVTGLHDLSHGFVLILKTVYFLGWNFICQVSFHLSNHELVPSLKSRVSWYSNLRYFLPKIGPNAAQANRTEQREQA